VAALLSELRDHQLARTQSLMSLSDSAASRLDREKKLAVETAASAVVQELRGEIDAMSVEMAEAHNATGKALSRAASVEAQLEVQQHHHTKEIAKLVAKVESAATEEKEIIAARKLLVEKTQQLADAQRREKRVRIFVASFAQLKEEVRKEREERRVCGTAKMSLSF
jgi:conjugal transfer/entry exclusion protein